jgi:prepilin signal peptidase PulO-like enzyme (type II secretory pathway)
MVLLAAFIGLFMGHLLDLFLGRLYSDEPLDQPFYRCLACRSAIDSTHLIPFLGYLRHRGRCAECGASARGSISLGVEMTARSVPSRHASPGASRLCVPGGSVMP